MRLIQQSWLKHCLAIGLASLGLTFAGCEDEDTTQVVSPSSPGQRGESCLARNDCAPGLACLNNICSKNNFEIERTTKECVQVDCEETADCCAGKPSEAPAKCADRVNICETPSLADCTLNASCVDDGDCGSGTCASLTCSNTGLTCTDDTDCTDTCDVATGICSITGNVGCTVDADCLATAGTCTGLCNCQNPDFDLDNPICTDEDCTEVCTLRCENERCVTDTSCENDDDCEGSPFGPLCDDGDCVECTSDDDCDEDADEQCLSGRCDTPCKVNEECPLNNTCEDGECIFTGCTSDRDCILGQQSRLLPGEARLLKCLPSDLNPDIKECKTECQNDGECTELEVCEDGFCRFVGCETDEECRSYLGIQPNPDNPDPDFVPKAVCREPDATGGEGGAGPF